MKTQAQLHLLRIFVNESDRWEGRALYETIIRMAREQGLAGATALRAIEGFGASGRVHSVKVLHLSGDVPIVVEIIDTPERIAAFLPTLDKLIAEGVVTIEPLHVLTYRRDQSEGEPTPSDDDIPFDTSEHIPPDDSMPVFDEEIDRTRAIMEAARASAAESRRVSADSIDFFLAMLHEPSGIATNLLRRLSVDIRLLTQSLREAVSRDESAAFLKTIQSKSRTEAKWLDHTDIGVEDLLLALCQIRPSAATDILMRLGVQPRDICKEVLALLGREEDWQRWLADHPDM
jgi:uncharacterized protein